jgi:murein DD-endopeptidase MepM/ murein hydrolase activator NlpD
VADHELAGELRDAIVVDFPLRGEWAAYHTPGSKIPSHGTDILGQRYAYDLLRVAGDMGWRFSPAGMASYLFVGVPTRDCYGWNQPIHAPFDGVVVAARDGIAERGRIHPVRELVLALKNSLTFRPTVENVQKLVGNHVILRRDDRVHAVFAHMTTGSVSVQDGQAVRTGDLLGRVGHTGNSTAPHLHFQLMDAADPLTARGLACAFRQYEVRRDGSWQLVEGGIPTSTDRIRSVG